MERIIGRFTGQKRGPLVLLIGAMHGNEPAGILAIREVFRLLERAQQTDAHFVFSGRVVGFIGNIKAFSAQKRFVYTDLNRIWGQRVVNDILLHDKTPRHAEEEELIHLVKAIDTEISEYQPTELFILDLHTTSAGGGIFSIPLETDPVSIRLAAELHAPVVMGLLKGLDGTFMHYANHPESVFKVVGRTIHTVAFEAGQHNDPESMNRSVSASIRLMRAVGCVDKKDVGSHHDAILQQYGKNLPKVTQITHVHHIQSGEQFVMRPGYINFQVIERGEHLADNEHGPIYAPQSGYILMPLYQPQGVDGFFIVTEVPPRDRLR